VALRIGNVYAPYQLSFVSEIAEAIVQRNRLLEFLPIYADRYIHPVHNDDVTRGILAAYWSDAPSCVVTLAGEYATVGDLFQICAGFLGRQLTPRPRRRADEAYLLLRREYHRRIATSDFITYLMAGRGRRVHRAYSLEETRKALGFSPQVPLREGVTEALQQAREAGSPIFS
jgi:nucleoside-diphosphate-sugar epimerase